MNAANEMFNIQSTLLSFLSNQHSFDDLDGYLAD